MQTNISWSDRYWARMQRKNLTWFRRQDPACPCRGVACFTRENCTHAIFCYAAFDAHVMCGGMVVTWTLHLRTTSWSFSEGILLLSQSEPHRPIYCPEAWRSKISIAKQSLNLRIRQPLLLQSVWIKNSCSGSGQSLGFIIRRTSLRGKHRQAASLSPLRDLLSSQTFQQATANSLDIINTQRQPL